MPAGRVSRVVGRIVVGLVLLFAFTALYVAAYHSPRARHVDIGVVGTPAQATQVQVALDAEHRGSFDVRTYAGESQARAALLRNQVEGVFVPSAPHARVLLAQALGVTPTETVTAALQRITAGSRAPATVQDLRPLPAILVLMLLGVSSVGGAVTYEFEPGFYGAVSQLLPPGAALTAVRNVQYFDWAATLAPLVVLGVRAAGGLGEQYGPHVRKPPAGRGVAAASASPAP